MGERERANEKSRDVRVNEQASSAFERIKVLPPPLIYLRESSIESQYFFASWERLLGKKRTAQSCEEIPFFFFTFIFTLIT